MIKLEALMFLCVIFNVILIVNLFWIQLINKKINRIHDFIADIKYKSTTAERKK